MQYSNSAHFSGDSQRLLAAASTILMTNGFEVVRQDRQQIEFVGPGLNSTRQNPLLGASRVVVRVQDGRLSVDAELGGVESLPPERSRQELGRNSDFSEFAKNNRGGGVLL